jgi:hypothetical protein
MASYTVDLSPSMVNLASEGSLDTSLLNGNSIQRTVYIEVYNSNDKKIVVANDGESFDDAMQGLTDLSNSGHFFIS